MTIALIPEPKRVNTKKGTFAFPPTASIGIADQGLYDVAVEAGALFRNPEIHVSIADCVDTVTLRMDASLKPHGYQLRITKHGIDLSGADTAGVYYGVQTLKQIARQSGATLPAMDIMDWPDFVDRGVYYDVCRGRVPTLDRLCQLVDELAHYKINQLQLYVEHTFAFRGHPKIGRGASPLTAEDILELDAYCHARHVELVPSLACFGHLATVLKHPEYHALAEDLGVGTFVGDENEMPAWFQGRKAWTLSPANPKSYDFLDSLFGEFLPLFRSKRFNICCDETFDLGLGQSFEMCRKKGKGVVYLDHIKTVRNLSRKYGKQVMFWGDIIRHYPSLIPEIPKDVTVLDWTYDARAAFDQIKDFKAAGLPFYACPGTSSWSSLFPRLPEAMANIAGFAAAGHKHGAQGLLNTDWGDGGHFNFMEFSYHGYLFGAEQGWHTGANQATFTDRFAQCFLGEGAKELSRAIEGLGDVAQTSAAGYYQSIWHHIFFASPSDAVLSHTSPVDGSVAKRGAIAYKPIRLNAALGRRELARVEKLRAVLDRYAKRNGCDPVGVLAYWVFAADTLAHAARKLTVLGPGGLDTPTARRQLKREMTSLMKRFETLWMARNRRSEINITLKRYRKAIKAL
jgi:hexosaminidase